MTTVISHACAFRSSPTLLGHWSSHRTKPLWPPLPGQGEGWGEGRPTAAKPPHPALSPTRGGGDRERALAYLTGVLVILGWCLLAGWGVPPGQARTLTVSPEGPLTTLQAAIEQANPGDRIVVQRGTYAGPAVIDKRLELVGHDWPVLDGGGSGTVVKLSAAGVRLTGFVIRNSGSSLDAENSGVAVEAPAAVVEHNRLYETLFGIYLRQASDSVIRDNLVHGKDLPVPRRGDAIRVWYSNGVRIVDNRVEHGRDVVLWYSENLTVRGNVVRDGRYGLHFMYCDDAHIVANRLGHNSVGAFLMYSRRLRLRRNVIAYNRGPSGYGVGLKDMDDAVIRENLFLDNRVGAFVDNSPREIDSTGRFLGNVFAYNTIALSLMPSVRRNWFLRNSFVDNQEQVHVAGGGRLRQNVWAEAGQGNYWSDYVGYDADRDGTGDVPYRAERLFEALMDRHPLLRLFAYSPAAQAIDFAARAFPFVKPQPKVTDASPMMAPVLPAGLPLPAAPDGRAAVGASAVLLALVAVAVLLPRLISRRRCHRSAAVRHEASSITAGTNVFSESDTQPGPGGGLMISVHDLSKRFGALVAIDRLSFDLAAGEAVALWGPNGAGKTTILRCLLGLLPCQGTVELAGMDVSTQGKAARRLVGFVPQELTFHDDLSVYETMRFYARLKRAPGAAIDELLGRQELTEHSRKPVRSLSGGMKQRLALAVALLNDPPMLMLDEPTANLDAAARGTLLALLGDLRGAGKTLIFSSHRLDEVATLADRVLVLEHGRLTADCAPQTLAQQTRWQATLWLHMPGEYVESALQTLSEHGFAASRNGAGVRVRVAPDEKGRPIHVLAQASIPVRDFELESHQGEA
jgi:nitrous oxidase accessory protein